MQFRHDPAVRAEFPQLAAVTLALDGVTDSAAIAAAAAPFLERASARLGERPESEFPEIAAWRRAFSQMSLKPTQYRCASEALLRRFSASAMPGLSSTRMTSFVAETDSPPVSRSARMSRTRWTWVSL